MTTLNRHGYQERERYTSNIRTALFVLQRSMARWSVIIVAFDLRWASTTQAELSSLEGVTSGASQGETNPVIPCRTESPSPLSEGADFVELAADAHRPSNSAGRLDL